MSVITNEIFWAIGILPVLHLLLSESFPTEIRTQSVGMISGLFLLNSSISLNFFPHMKELMTLHGLLFFYGGMSMITSLWGLKTIQDHRNKSLTKVEEEYEENQCGNMSTMKNIEKHYKTFSCNK